MHIPDELRGIVDESARACNAHAIDLVLRGDHRRPVVEVFVDAEGPVTTNLCAEISRRIAAGIKAGGVLPEAYRLEVSSPGIDRPLQHPWQFRKHNGRKLHVKLHPSGGLAGEVRGTLQAVEDEGILLLTADGVEMHISYSAIHEAKVMPPW